VAGSTYQASAGSHLVLIYPDLVLYLTACYFLCKVLLYCIALCDSVTPCPLSLIFNVLLTTIPASRSIQRDTVTLFMW
jgi:hypothetical protein